MWWHGMGRGRMPAFNRSTCLLLPLPRVHAPGCRAGPKRHPPGPGAAPHVGRRRAPRPLQGQPGHGGWVDDTWRWRLWVGAHGLPPPPFGARRIAYLWLLYCTGHLGWACKCLPSVPAACCSLLQPAAPPWPPPLQVMKVFPSSAIQFAVRQAWAWAAHSLPAARSTYPLAPGQPACGSTACAVPPSSASAHQCPPACLCPCLRLCLYPGRIMPLISCPVPARGCLQTYDACKDVMLHYSGRGAAPMPLAAQRLAYRGPVLHRRQTTDALHTAPAQPTPSHPEHHTHTHQPLQEPAT